jgi:hypothetical protein
MTFLGFQATIQIYHATLHRYLTANTAPHPWPTLKLQRSLSIEALLTCHLRERALTLQGK